MIRWLLKLKLTKLYKRREQLIVEIELLAEQAPKHSYFFDREIAASKELAGLNFDIERIRQKLGLKKEKK